MLEVRLLGRFEVQLDDVPLVIASRPAQSLLAYLLLNGSAPQRREQIAGLLWSDTTDANARRSLRQALWQLRRAFSVPHSPAGEFFLTDDVTVSFNAEVDHWLDVDAVTAKVANGVTADELIGMVSHYKGELLAGFYDEWVCLERERVQAVFEHKMKLLLDRLVDARRWEEILDWGERWIALGHTPEPAYRALMIAHARLGDAAQMATVYQRCVAALRDDLDVEPSELTRTTYERLSKDRSAQPRPIEPLSPPADVLDSKPAMCVAREVELARLAGGLDLALSGQGQIVFVIGEAGSGKTTLLQEFARQAMVTHSDVIALDGKCDAYAGQGDPYLPFLEALRLLCGDIEARLSGRTITRDHARRIRAALPQVVQALIEHGPDLIDQFVSGAELVNRLESAPPDRAAPLRERLLQRAPEPALSFHQNDLFTQVTRVLRAIAQPSPLVLLVDDLQWADTGSINLLFHLARELGGSRLFIVGAYRPEDVAQGRSGNRHPLEPVIHELAAKFGDIQIDLGQTEGLVFIDQLLDSEPNQLGAGFRAMLHRQAGNNPLFTIELLRSLQERGDLIHNATGQWCESPNLNWDALPARIEAVIADRLGRLPPDWQRALAIASVEGEEFTAEVVARVQGLSERTLIEHLSGELSHQSRWVSPHSLQRVNGQRFSRYRFRHILFQKYLYGRLDPIERAQLHEAIGAALEAAYGADCTSAASTLAWHFEAAGLIDKAIDYCLMAAAHARNLCTYQAAIEQYQRALTLLDEQGPAGLVRAARTAMTLGQLYHTVYDFERSRETYQAAFALWARVEDEQRAVKLPPAPHVLRLLQEDLPTFDESKINYIPFNYLFRHTLWSLFEITPDLDVVPAMALSWEILDDGKVYLFHLRRDAGWSDGHPVTAHDFECSARYTLNPATQALRANLFYDIRGARDYHQGRITDANSLGIRALDDYTLRVELEEPIGHFLTAIQDMRPIPRHLFDRHGDEWGALEHFAANGPFMIDHWEPHRQITLRRNPYYPGRFSGNVECVQLQLYELGSSSSSPEVVAQKYDASEIDVLRVSTATWAWAQQQHLSELHSVPGAGLSGLQFRYDRWPVQDIRVRRALVHAIDRTYLSQSILNDLALPAYGGVVPPGIPGHSEQIGLAYDPLLARQLLAEAGFPDGQGFPVLACWGGIGPNPQHIGEYLNSQWLHHLGVQSTWTYLTPTASHEVTPSTDLSLNLWLTGWVADYLDPSNFLSTYIQNEIIRNSYPWHQPEFEQLLSAAAKITKHDERIRLYQAADRLLIQSVVYAPLSYNKNGLVIKPWVKKYPVSALFSDYWQDVIIVPH
jgi:ABC-type oligopeptide transport system substrate-binding subunit/DNA-binding SARP family transcriptional activator/energy-coupling factor transporter ATP-binding protein EcfA2